MPVLFFSLSVFLSPRISRGGGRGDRSVREICPPAISHRAYRRSLSYFLARIVVLSRFQRETLVDVEWLFIGDNRTHERKILDVYGADSRGESAEAVTDGGEFSYPTRQRDRCAFFFQKRKKDQKKIRVFSLNYQCLKLFSVGYHCAINPFGSVKRQIFGTARNCC